jgi:hypothetical protein
MRSQNCRASCRSRVSGSRAPLRALAATPAPLQPLDASMLDGYLCGVIVQPRLIENARADHLVAECTDANRHVRYLTFGGDAA